MDRVPWWLRPIHRLLPVVIFIAPGSGDVVQACRVLGRLYVVRTWSLERPMPRAVRRRAAKG